MTTIRYCLHCGAVYRTSYQRCPLDGHQLVEGVAEPLIGQVLDGRYRIQSCVGHGAMGRVYRAQHVRMGRAFAVKVMYGDFAADPDMRARFMREAEAASRLDHPNVVAAVDVGATEGGIPYLVMEFLEGQTLKRWVDTAGPLTEADMTWIGISVSRGLAHAHLRGLVHRDLKPENIFVVDIDGRRLAKIVDFGIAFLADHGTNARLTQTGHIMGTPYFMPPEQCSGQRVDARADIFSLGLCLFYGMVGRPPFSGDAAQVIHRIVSSAVPPLDSVIPPDRVSTQFSRVVAKMTAHDREHRYQTAEACIAALEGRDPSDIPAPGRAPKRTEIDPTDISDMGIPGPGSEPSFLPAPPPRAPVARGVGRFLIPVVIGLAIGMVAFAGRFLVTAQAPADAELEPAPLVDSSPEPVEDAPPEEAPTAAPPPILTAQPTPKVDPTPEPPPAARSGKGRGRRGRTRRTSGASGATAAAKGRKTGASKAPSTKAPSTKAPSTKAPVAAQTPAPEVEA
ncbi:MAG: protein kinase, partial [Myxococcota bacterium]